ncbi:membrane hypothetical protein [Candidatus Desulfarcum epimagneticum]|uniref:Glycosyltransferase RgtA/B/C/D-like domain-containing protein n=1 Tax=uncultured Desulfobacteraceae bacterium TaxID=218296 RepID=A0A484HJI5_9BACT|nr:membrane hypothetical protein [uncultured Desulfobacteraceae bacterium]
MADRKSVIPWTRLKAFLFSDKTAGRVPWAMAGILLAYALLFYFRLSFADDLDLIPLMEKYDAGALSLKDFFLAHRESHFHAGAYFLLVPLMILTGWNNLWGVVLNAFLLILSHQALSRHLRRMAFSGDDAMKWAAALTAFFLFSLDQAGNLLSSWQIAVFMNLFATVAGIVLFSREELHYGHFFPGVFCAAVAVYNFSTGLALLPTLGLMLVFHPEPTRRRRVVMILLWLAFSMALAFHFKTAVLAGAGHTDMSTGSKMAFVLIYSLKYLGSSISRYASDWVIPFSAAGLFFAAAQVRLLMVRFKTPILPLMAPLAMMAYALVVSLITALGRLAFDTDQALVSRYISFSNFFWLGLCLMGVMALSRIKEAKRPVVWMKTDARKIIFRFLLILILMKTGNIVQVAHKTAGTSLQNQALRHRLIDSYPHAAPKDLKSFYPFGPETARRYLDYLHERKTHLFRK